jgi:2-dehydro-3-deoxygluconokinase
VRNGLNFTERGFGVRAALGCSDRGHTAVSQLKPGDVDWDRSSARGRALVPHRRHLLRALGDDAAGRARGDGGGAAHGTVVSYDLNYRESLWKGIGGKRARRRSTASWRRWST